MTYTITSLNKEAKLFLYTTDNNQDGSFFEIDFPDLEVGRTYSKQEIMLMRRIRSLEIVIESTLKEFSKQKMQEYYIRDDAANLLQENQ